MSGSVAGISLLAPCVLRERAQALGRVAGDAAEQLAEALQQAPGGGGFEQVVAVLGGGRRVDAHLPRAYDADPRPALSHERRRGLL